MRKLVFITLMSIVVSGVAQERSLAFIGDTTVPIWHNEESNLEFIGKYTLNYLDENKYTLSLFFVGGIADWFIEACRFRQEDIMRMFPNDYENILPGYTWKRKWKNGDPAQGEKFFGSSTFLAWTQDPYHAVRTGETLCYTIAICIKIGEKKPWYEYAIDIVTHQMAKAAGGKLCMYLIEDSGLTFK